MTTLTITGKLHAKLEEQQISPTFKKRTFILTTDYNTQYPQQVEFYLTQEKCKLLDLINLTQIVEVSFNLRGKEYISSQGASKYFVNLEAWRILPKSS